MSEKRLSIVWSTLDVQSQAESMGLSVDDDQAYEILEEIIDDHDASIGISWDTINYHIQEYKNDHDEIVETENNSGAIKVLPIEEKPIYCVHCKSVNIVPMGVEDRGHGQGMYYWCKDCKNET